MSDDYKILLCWIPSPTGIDGNKQVDKAARSTWSMVPEKNFQIPYMDLKIQTNTPLDQNIRPPSKTKKKIYNF